MPQIYIRDDTFRFEEGYEPVEADRILLQAVVEAWPFPPQRLHVNQIEFVLNARAIEDGTVYLNYDVYAPSPLPPVGEDVCTR